MLTYEVVREFLDYSEETGKLTWRERARNWFLSDGSWKSWNTIHAGKEAFTSISIQSGYRQGLILGKKYQAHRIIWLWMAGKWPEFEIDHENHVRSDNRWLNLRDTKENRKNHALYRNSSSGHLGVYWNRHAQKWRAQIAVNGQKIHLGSFDKKEEAVAVRKKAETKYGFHKNHGGLPIGY